MTVLVKLLSQSYERQSWKLGSHVGSIAKSLDSFTKG